MRFVVTYVEWLQLSITLSQRPPLEPPWRSLTSLIRDELIARNGENVIELLQGSLLCFRDEEEDHYECDNVQTTVEAESTYSLVRTIVPNALCEEHTHLPA